MGEGVVMQIKGEIDHHLYEPVLVPVIRTDYSNRAELNEHFSEYAYKEYPKTIRPIRPPDAKVEVYWRKREQPK